MRRSTFLMALLQERKLATAQLNWHLEPEDEEDAAQREVCEILTKIIRRTPHLQKFLMALLEAIWYGRYGAQLAWDYGRIAGQDLLYACRWAPVHGDKVQYRYHYPGLNEWRDDGVPVILVHAAYVNSLPNAQTVLTDRGRGLVLRDRYWRERFVIHKHEIDDADYFDGEMAGAVHGVGVRSRIYWFEWLKQEMLEWITTYMQRTGLGLTLFFFDQSNPKAQQEAEKAARRSGKDTVIVWPRPIGAENQGPGVERIETTTTGSEFLFQMLTDYFEKHEERYVVGQTLSAGTEGSGLGGMGVAKLHADTKYRITKFDAQNLGETLTGSEEEPGLVWVLQRWNFPEAEFQTRFVFDVDKPNAEEQLNAAKIVYDMGIELDANEVRGIAGLSKPEEGAELVARMDQMELEAATQARYGPPERNGVQHQRESSAERYAAEGGGHWVTIGGHREAEGEHVGGRAVLLDGQGNIIGGDVPKEWHGKPVGDLPAKGKGKVKDSSKSDSPKAAKEPRAGFRGVTRQPGGDYTVAGDEPLAAAEHARVKALRLPPAWSDVRVSRDPESPLQAVGYDRKGREQRVYSAEHSEKATAEKFARVKALVAELPKIDMAIRHTLSGPAGPDQEAAATLLLMRKTGFRIGSERDTQTE
ncbi:MAG: phage portal protein family protein, partial [Anaerolineales bacterium]